MRSASSTTCPELVAAGLFLEQYLTVLDNLGATDYADLIRRAVIEAETHRDELRARCAHVFVDEYQDTDPGQVALLRALAGDGRNLTVVGDPHQSIYGFRGADVRGILDFPAQLPDLQRLARPGRRAPAHPPVRSAHPARRRPRRQPADPHRQHRPPRRARPSCRPEAVPGPQGDGRVEVVTYDTERAEAERLADLLRRAHLEDGIAWDRMAVLVRSGRTSIPPLRRALAAAGVPVEVASDDLPLVRDPAVLPLLDGLRAVVNLDNDDPDSPDFLDPGASSRSSSRRSAGSTPPTSARSSAGSAPARRSCRRHGPAHEPRAPAARRGRGGLPRRASRAPTSSAPLPWPRCCARGPGCSPSGSSVEDVLWHFWSETSWPQRLRRQVDLGGASARRAHRDLDAIVALFELASRVVDQREHVGVGAFFANLVEQQLPADTLAEQGVRGKAVRLLTAHRSKGLEWDLVVVAHVQQEGWPDLRRRTTLLGADRIGVDASGHPDLVPPVTTRALLMEERRLFYVACTRARRRLVVSAVKSPDDDGEQPSRFLEELGVTIEHQDGRPARPLSLGGLVAELRRHAADPAVSALRSARPPPAGWRRWRPRRSTVASSCRPPTRRPGGAPAAPPARSSRSATPSARCRSPPACSTRSCSAPRSGSSSARPAASRPCTSPPTSARSCTPSPSASPSASCRPRSTR